MCKNFSLNFNLLFCFFSGFIIFYFYPEISPNDIYWNAEISSEWQYSCQFFPSLARSAKTFFRKVLTLHIIHDCYHIKKCIEMCQFGEIFRFWTTKYYLFMVKTMTPKSPQNDIFLFWIWRNFCCFWTPEIAPKRQILHVV